MLHIITLLAMASAVALGIYLAYVPYEEEFQSFSQVTITRYLSQLMLGSDMHVKFGKFTSRDGESLESYYSRFYKMMNELVRNQCHVTNHQVNVQFLLQLQPEWQRTRGKAIVTFSAPTYDQEPDTVTEDDEMSKDKEIDKLMALISLSFKKIYKPTNNNLRTSSNSSRANQDNSPRLNRGTGYDNQRAVNVAGARENVGTPVVQKSGIQCYNCKEYGHVSRECQKPKRVKDATYHKEKMLLCKQEEAGVQLNAEQADWKDDTDDESDDQELEAHYMYMAQLQEVTPDQVDNSGPIFDDEPMHKVQNNNDNYNVFAMENEHPEQPESSNDIYLAEHSDTNITIDSLDICYDRVQDDQDDTDDLDQERDLLASLIQKLKCIQTRLVAGIDHGKTGRGLADVAAYDPSMEASIADIMKSLRLEGPSAKTMKASRLQPAYEQHLLPIHRKEDNVVVGETSLSDSLN
ncbi:integrase, catalytic region, zinc finger, CCHC-type containing protein, partial [Tanacetum coccineum]